MTKLSQPNLRLVAKLPDRWVYRDCGDHPRLRRWLRLVLTPVQRLRLFAMIDAGKYMTPQQREDFFAFLREQREAP